MCSALLGWGLWQFVTAGLRHPLFTDIAKDQPLKISEKSHIAPFDSKDFKMAIAEKGVYTCGANLFWANLFYTACPGVPINRAGVFASGQHCVLPPILVIMSQGRLPFQCKPLTLQPHQVQYLVDYYFDAPGDKPFPGVVCIGVTDASSPIAAANRGWLKGISPEEARHALVLAIARDLRKGLPIDGWKTMVLSTVVEFRKMNTDDDFFWEATKLRESIGAQYESMYYSAACHQGYTRRVKHGCLSCTGKR